MHLTLWLNSSVGSLRLPLANLHFFQSLLYSVLPPERAAFLHSEGYVVDGRRMKLFAMSWPVAPKKPRIDETSITFALPLRLVVSTPVNATLDGLAGGALNAEKLRLGNNIVFCERIEVVQHRIEGESVEVRTLSPITCYERLERGGRPFTLYLNPHQADFSVSVHNNLTRKFRALYSDRPIPEGRVTVTPLGKIREQIARFSPDTPFPIKGWSGRFRLDGPRELLQMALDAGLGAKNSSGWGCVE